MNIDTSDDAFISAIKAVVAERPDYVYEPQDENERGPICLYVHRHGAEEREWECGCLIGHALHRMGVPLSYFEDKEGQGARKLLRTMGFSVRIVNLGARVQASQDLGDTWGEALRSANARDCL